MMYTDINHIAFDGQSLQTFLDR